jgi:hypothetical protein
LKIEDELPALRKGQHTLKPQSAVISKHGRLYPVPANESATFVYEHDKSVTITLTINDLTGKSLMNYQMENYELHFPVSILAPGIYYVRVYEGKAVKEEHKLSVIR